MLDTAQNTARGHKLSKESATFRFVCFSDFYHLLQAQLEEVFRIQTSKFAVMEKQTNKQQTKIYITVGGK